MSDAVERSEQLPEGTLVADGYDEALIGSALRAGEFVAVYDRQKCIAVLRLQFEKACGQEWACDEDHAAEAEEFFEYNTMRAAEYLGAKAPVFVELLEGGQS